jgi:hypothetical protein
MNYRNLRNATKAATASELLLQPPGLRACGALKVYNASLQRVRRARFCPHWPNRLCRWV